MLLAFDRSRRIAAVSGLTDVTGVVMSLDGRVGTWGHCPTVIRIAAVVAALPDDSAETVLVVDQALSARA